MKHLKLALLSFLSTGIVACSNESSGVKSSADLPEIKMDNKIYTIIDRNQVGVLEESNHAASYFYQGKLDVTGKQRRSVYYLDEGAVVTEFHTDAIKNSVTSIMPRPVRQMLNFELDEFTKALKFYKNYTDTAKNLPIWLMQPVTARPNGHSPYPADSLSGGPK